MRLHNSFSVVANTLGILGTFIGVFIGLYYFDATNINQSVPKLIEGLKTAFVTSIFGMTMGLIYRIFFQSILPPPKLHEKVASQAIEDAKDLLRALLDEQKSTNRVLETISTNAATEKSLQSIGEYFSKLPMAITDSVTTPISQELGHLQISLDSFAQKIIEDHSTQIMEALGEVISDFNQNLTEQFGENLRSSTRRSPNSLNGRKTIAFILITFIRNTKSRQKH